MIRKNENNIGVLLPGVTLSILSLREISGLKDEIKIYRLNRTKGIIWTKTFHESRLPSETRFLIYRYKNGPCSIKREIRLIDNNWNRVNNSCEKKAYTPIKNPRYNSHKISILSWRARGFFWNSRIVKKKALNEAIRKTNFIPVKLLFFPVTSGIAPNFC